MQAQIILNNEINKEPSAIDELSNNCTIIPSVRMPKFSHYATSRGFVFTASKISAKSIITVYTSSGIYITTVDPIITVFSLFATNSNLYAAGNGGLVCYKILETGRLELDYSTISGGIELTSVYQFKDLTFLGTRDATLKILKREQLIHTIRINTVNSISAILYVDEISKFFIATNSKIHLFDAESFLEEYIYFEIGADFFNMKFIDNDLVAISSNGGIYCFDALNLERKERISLGKNIFLNNLNFVFEKNYIFINNSSKKTVKIYETENLLRNHEICVKGVLNSALNSFLTSAESADGVKYLWIVTPLKKQTAQSVASLQIYEIGQIQCDRYEQTPEMTPRPMALRLEITATSMTPAYLKSPVVDKDVQTEELLETVETPKAKEASSEEEEVFSEKQEPTEKEEKVESSLPAVLAAVTLALSLIYILK